MKISRYSNYTKFYEFVFIGLLITGNYLKLQFIPICSGFIRVLEQRIVNTGIVRESAIDFF